MWATRANCLTGRQLTTLLAGPASPERDRDAIVLAGQHGLTRS